MSPEPTAVASVWRCARGHEFVVSEEAMRTAVVEPRCGLIPPPDEFTGRSLQRCGCRLVKRLRPFPSIPPDREDPPPVTDVSPDPTAGQRKAFEAYYEMESATQCRARLDGDCSWIECPQVRDGEPHASHRHCPLDLIPFTADREDPRP